MEKMDIRTDLALESREKFERDDVEIPGVKIREKHSPLKRVHTTIVQITNKEGAEIMKKPKGSYITMEIPEFSVADEEIQRDVSSELCRYLLRLLKKRKPESVLVVGLGNRDITPDALGPRVVEHLAVSRHIAMEYGRDLVPGGGSCVLSSIAPGVMGQTGMETLEIVKGIVAETSPDLVVAVDALAARSLKRLNCTIQITDTGINPGSGVFNHRNGLNQETLGIPVIGIGVPTVVDAATIVFDALEDGGGGHSDLPERLQSMFVTPKDVDETLKALSLAVAEAINLAVDEIAV